MLMLKADVILEAIRKARAQNSLGTLKNDLKQSTIPEFWNTQQRSAHINKLLLLNLAKIPKHPKPNPKHDRLGHALANYINKLHSSYDPDFTKQIKSLAPHWFISRSDIANKKKQQLIKLAKSNQPRPKQRKHPLGHSLCYYTDKKKSTYDPIFTQQIKKLAPHWFILKVQQSTKNKKILIQMAKSNHPRPKQRKHPLGHPLCNYINKTHPSYDPDFTNKLKSLAPHWFSKS